MKLAELVTHIGDDLVNNLKDILTNMVNTFTSLPTNGV